MDKAILDLNQTQCYSNVELTSISKICYKFGFQIVAVESSDKQEIDVDSNDEEDDDEVPDQYEYFTKLYSQLQVWGCMMRERNTTETRTVLFVSLEGHVLC